METKRKTKKEILIHIKTKVKFTPSNKKLLIHESIWTFFFCVKAQFLLFVLDQTQNELQNLIIKCTPYISIKHLIILERKLKESFLEFQTLDGIHNSSLSHDHVAHLKGISRDYISLAIPREENLRAAKCCLTVSAKRESRKEKG